MTVSLNRDAVQDSDGDLIHMGHAIMTFYSALIDLLGRCAPEMHVSSFLAFSSSFRSISTNVLKCSGQLYLWYDHILRLCKQ